MRRFLMCGFACFLMIVFSVVIASAYGKRTTENSFYLVYSSPSLNIKGGEFVKGGIITSKGKALTIGAIWEEEGKTVLTPNGAQNSVSCSDTAVLCQDDKDKSKWLAKKPGKVFIYAVFWMKQAYNGEEKLLSWTDVCYIEVQD